jgi:hypothetical protein
MNLKNFRELPLTASNQQFVYQSLLPGICVYNYKNESLLKDTVMTEFPLAGLYGQI